MSKIRVGVLRGGPSSQYDISLKTGSHVLQQLPQDTYEPVDIFISKDGLWHIRGMEISPGKALNSIEVIFNALHGEYGEDGKVQRILETFKIPYTGSKTLASALSLNKVLAKNRVEKEGVKVPRHILIKYSPNLMRELFDIFRSFPQPTVVKPSGCGSSVGVYFADSFEKLVSSVYDALEYSPTVLLEEFVRGKEVSCGIVEGYRGEDYYSLFPVEITLPKQKSLFDYEAKNDESNLSYNQKVRRQCPGNLSQGEKEQVQKLAQQIHELFGLRHYSKSDFIISPYGIYFLEINALPDLTPTSLVPLALKEAGCEFPEFLDHLINIALAKK